MKVGESAGSPQVFGTEEQQGIDNEVKQQKAAKSSSETQTESAKPVSPKEVSSKKGELSLSGQAQKAALQWKPGPEGIQVPMLQYGSKGEQVKALQERINEHRQAKGLPPIKEDGIYGKDTQNAVREFQKDKKLNPDGVAGLETQDKAGLSMYANKLHSKGESVKRLQQQINEHRKATGLPPIKEDGVFGTKTDEAVREFQKAAGLKEDGAFGPETYAALKDIRNRLRDRQAAEQDAKETEIESFRFESDPSQSSQTPAGTGSNVKPQTNQLELDQEEKKGIQDAIKKFG